MSESEKTHLSVSVSLSLSCFYIVITTGTLDCGEVLGAISISNNENCKGGTGAAVPAATTLVAVETDGDDDDDDYGGVVLDELAPSIPLLLSPSRRKLNKLLAYLDINLSPKGRSNS